MPVKIAAKSGQRSLDFSAAPVNNIPGNAPTLYGFGNVGPFPYPLIGVGLTFPSDYSIIFGNGGGVYFPAVVLNSNVTIGGYIDDTTILLSSSNGAVGGVTFPYLHSPINYDAAILGTDANLVEGTINWTHDPTFTEAPLGNAAFTPTIDGPCLIGQGSTTPVDEFYNAGIDDIWHNAFKDDLDPAYPLAVINLPFAGINRALISHAASVHLVEWTEAAFNPGGAFNSTTYTLQLADAADDLIFQAFLASGFANFYFSASTEKFVLASKIGLPTFEISFAFEPDFSSYERIDITGSPIFDGLYFQSVDGTDWIIGVDNLGNGQFSGANFLNIHGQVHIQGVISLGCWSPCANLLYHFIGEDLPNG